MLHADYDRFLRDEYRVHAVRAHQRHKTEAMHLANRLAVAEHKRRLRDNRGKRKPWWPLRRRQPVDVPAQRTRGPAPAARDTTPAFAGKEGVNE